MVKIKTEYELEHDDVLKIICKWLLDENGMDVKPEELRLQLTEGRINEGYSSGGDQPARINRIWFKR